VYHHLQLVQSKNLLVAARERLSAMEDTRRMTKLITRLFGPPERIGCSKHFLSYLYRWTIFGNTRYKIYLHRSCGSVPNEDLCRYPKRFISLGIAESPNPNSAQATGPEAAWTLLIGKCP